MSRQAGSEKPKDLERFTEFMKRLVAVPHSEIKAALDAEKKEKAQRRASHVSSEKD